MFWVGGSGGSVVSGSVDSRNVKLHTYGRYICVKIFENWGRNEFISTSFNLSIIFVAIQTHFLGLNLV